jgi:hypothetical protein
VLVTVGAFAAPAMACSHGVSVRVGPVFLGVGERPCPAMPLVVAQAPVYLPPPPPPMYVMPPPLVVAPVAMPPPVVRQRVVEAPAPEGPALLAVKYLPGASAEVGLSQANGLVASTPSFTHDVGLELRLSRWFALRSDAEFRPGARSWDVLGLKLWLAPDSVVKPFLSASVSGSQADALPGHLAIGVVAAAGLDVMLGRHFFLSGEARYRVAPGACCADVPQVTGLIGGGVAFF